MNKRGISVIVASTLLILIVSLAVMVVWLSIIPVLQENTPGETGRTYLSVVSTQGYTVWDEENMTLSVQVEQGSEEGEVIGVQFTFRLNGSSISTIIYDAPGKNLRKIYNFNLTSLGGKPDSISVAPVFRDSTIGDMTSLDDEKIPNGKIVGGIIDVDDEYPLPGDPDPEDPDPEDPDPEPEPISTFRDLTQNVLVLYNVNALDARSIAEHYASVRGINNNRLCAIQMPTGQIATKDQLVGARKTIVENCICGIVSGSVSGSCNLENINEISKVSPITHLAIIKGIPPRLTGTGWSSDSEDPSLDWALSFMLYKDFNVFEESTSGSYPETNYGGSYSDGDDFQPSSSINNYIRDIDLEIDQYVAYGRIEAMNTQRTLDLIDRTIAAENQGVTGSFLHSHRSSTETFDLFRDLSSSRDSVCEDYLDNSEKWPYESCRAGSSGWNGEIPGEGGSKIPQPINAGIYLGEEYDGNGHTAFDGFYNMINWHKSEYSCIELCKDTADPDACRATSTDYFKEINTDCVGVADGFIGWQLRSWPVQYYGVWPTGWSHLSGGNGANEKTPPVILNDAGNNYLHYGALDASPNPKCTLEDGSVVDCPETIAVNLRQSIDINPDVLMGSAQQFNFTFRHRNPLNSNGRMRVYLYVYFTDGTHKVTTSQYVYLNEESIDWKDESLFFEISDQGGKTMKSLLLDISSSIGSVPEGWLDLDEIYLYDITQDKSVSNLDYGNFDAPYVGGVSPGDYAANVIDRLGGIAWWGSGSHFLTGGWAFSEPWKFAGAFYSGRTLGESLMYDSRNAESSIIYGDPLYNPAGIKIYSSQITSNIGNTDLGYSLSSSDLADEKFYINAIHGKANIDRTNWNLSVCLGDNIDSCNWNEIKSGQSAASQLEIREVNTYITSLTSETVLLKLRVWNPGEEDNDLVTYGRINYNP